MVKSRKLNGIENVALNIDDETMPSDQEQLPSVEVRPGTECPKPTHRPSLDRLLSTISLPTDVTNQLSRSPSNTSTVSSSSSSPSASPTHIKQTLLLRSSQSCKYNTNKYCKHNNNNNNNNEHNKNNKNNNNNNYNNQNQNSHDEEHRKNRCIEISRDVLDLDTFGHQADCVLYREKTQPSLVSQMNTGIKGVCASVSPSSCVRSLFPIIDWLPKYSVKSNLLADIIAGFTISILHIPQGIAYSLLAGLGPVHGLYISFFPALIYVFMGTSPHLSIGSFAIASIMLNNIATKIGAVNGPVPKVIFDISQNYTLPAMATTTVLPPIVNSSLLSTASTSSTFSVLFGLNDSRPSTVPMSSGDYDFSAVIAMPPTTIEVLTSVCLLCGFIQIAMGFLRLGSLSLILSEHLVSAFSTAVAFHVATAQFSHIFGFESLPRVNRGPLKLIKSWIVIGQHLDHVNQNTVIFSTIMIAILLLFKELIEPRLKKRNSYPIPIDLLFVVFSILMSWLFKFNRNFAIQVVKNVPTGLPKPTVPRFDLMPDVFVDSVILSIVCFAVSLSLAKIFAKKHGYQVRANQELVALGSANLFSSFFLAYPCSAALSRSTLQEKVGGKTQIAGLVSCTIILAVLLFLAPYLYHLPKCTLSCIILVALKSMFMQLGEFTTFWRISKLDGFAWMATFWAVILLDIDLGLIAGISFSILSLMIRLAVPKISLLGQFSATEIYVERDAYDNLDHLPGIKIVRFGSPLFYLNVETFREKIMSTICQTISDQRYPGVQLVKPGDKQQSSTITTLGTTTLSSNNSVDLLNRRLILDLSGVSFIDKAGIDSLVEVVRKLQSERISTSLALCPFHLVQSLESIHFADRVKSSCYPCKIYPTIHDAVIDSL